jgi:hypothetical protein
MSLKSLDQIKQLLKDKSLTTEQKRKLLISLKSMKEEYTGNIGGETDITNADNLQVNEDGGEITSDKTILAKTFDTQGDFDSYVNQHRGIEMTPKEEQSIIGYKKTKPNQQDKFFVKYETSDDFGNNTTTVIKKLKEGNQFCYTAFIKTQNVNKDSKGKNEEGPMSLKELAPANVQKQSNKEDAVTVNDTIRINKTITFADDTTGSEILGDFLRKLDV